MKITAIPQLLEETDIQGAIVTIDAAGCQTAIAEKIRNKKGDYILALIRKSRISSRRSRNFFSQARNVEFEKDKACVVATTLEKGHGRIEECEIVITNNLDWLDEDQRIRWKGLRSIRLLLKAVALSGSRNFRIVQ